MDCGMKASSKSVAPGTQQLAIPLKQLHEKDMKFIFNKIEIDRTRVNNSLIKFRNINIKKIKY
jgi:hypothetical protein